MRRRFEAIDAIAAKQGCCTLGRHSRARKSLRPL
jgi:hypothetical protein